MTGNEELKTVAFMITLFCRKKHKSQRGRLCPDCAFLLEYVRLVLFVLSDSLLPFGYAGKNR